MARRPGWLWIAVALAGAGGVAAASKEGLRAATEPPKAEAPGPGAPGKKETAKPADTAADKKADKAVEKTPEKTADKTPEKEPAGEKAADKADDKTADKAADKAPAHGTEKGPVAAPKHDEPAPHRPPPLSINQLREEIRHSPHEVQVAETAERGKLEQLAAEINKAREGLRQDTARLEALLEKRAAAAPQPSVDVAGVGEPGKKTPTSLDGLAKAMRGMKPEQAAPIISRLERKMAADVLVRMPAIDAGKVMAQCKPEVAAELATEIASRTPRSELRR